MKDFEFTFTPNKEDIENLRKLAFSRSFQDRIDLKKLNWNWVDSQSIHLGLYNKKQLLSCIRLSFFMEKELLENSTQIKVPEHVPRPWALISRVVTDPDYEGKRLHSILRTRALEACAHFKIQSVLGTMEEDSLRLTQLYSLGYEILNRQSHWKESFIQNDHDILLVGLVGEEKILEATKKLQQKLDLQPLNQFPSNHLEVKAISHDS